MRRAIERAPAAASSGVAARRQRTDDRVAVGGLTRAGPLPLDQRDSVGGVEALRIGDSRSSPSDAGQPRALALAVLAQHLMIDGAFDEQRAARRAGTDDRPRRRARRRCLNSVTPPARWASTSATWAESIEGSRCSRRPPIWPVRPGRLDDLMRCYANRTTLLDLDLRREAALAVVKRRPRDARAAACRLTYGAFLRGNAADILFQLGRWDEAEAECRAAMEWPAGRRRLVQPDRCTWPVLVESRADEEAARLVGQTLLQLETVPAGQWSALVQRAAVSLALWRGDATDARRAAATYWPRVVATGDAVQIAASASTALEAAPPLPSTAATTATGRRVADAGELAARVMPVAEKAVATSRLPRTLGALREAELHLATARAHQNRLKGRASVDEWADLAERWALVPIPYHVAKARWWQASAALESRSSRDVARDALNDAARIAASCPRGHSRGRSTSWPCAAELLCHGTGRVAIPIEPIVERAVRSATPRRRHSAPLAEASTLPDVPSPSAWRRTLRRSARRASACRHARAKSCSSWPKADEPRDRRTALHQRTPHGPVSMFDASSPRWVWPVGWKPPVSPSAWAWCPTILDQPLSDCCRSTLTGRFRQNWSYEHRLTRLICARAATLIAVALRRPRRRLRRQRPAGLDLHAAAAHVPARVCLRFAGRFWFPRRQCHRRRVGLAGHIGVARPHRDHPPATSFSSKRRRRYRSCRTASR